MKNNSIFKEDDEISIPSFHFIPLEETNEQNYLNQFIISDKEQKISHQKKKMEEEKPDSDPEIEEKIIEQP